MIILHAEKSSPGVTQEGMVCHPISTRPMSYQGGLNGLDNANASGNAQGSRAIFFDFGFFCACAEQPCSHSHSLSVLCARLLPHPFPPPRRSFLSLRHPVNPSQTHLASFLFRSTAVLVVLLLNLFTFSRDYGVTYSKHLSRPQRTAGIFFPFLIHNVDRCL